MPNIIEASINLPKDITADKVKLFVRTSFEKPIKSVNIDGKDWKDWDQTREAIVFPAQIKTIKVIVSY